VLGVYLNQTYYGGLAYGVEAAAQTYFGKSPS
jgi:membrane carboxypeptidase/penicillin-binding protein